MVSFSWIVSFFFFFVKLQLKKIFSFLLSFLFLSFPFPFLLPHPSGESFTPLAYLQTQNHKQSHLALDRLTAVNLLGTKLILPLHRLLKTWPTMVSVNTSQEVRWMSNDALSKSECFCDEVEKTLSKYEKMENKKKIHTEMEEQYSELSWEYTNTGTFKALHKHYLVLNIKNYV